MIPQLSDFRKQLTLAMLPAIHRRVVLYGLDIREDF